MPAHLFNVKQTAVNFDKIMISKAEKKHGSILITEILSLHSFVDHQIILRQTLSETDICTYKSMII